MKNIVVDIGRILVIVLSISANLVCMGQTNINYIDKEKSSDIISNANELLTISKNIQQLDHNLSLDAANQALLIANELEDEKLQISINHQIGVLQSIAGNASLAITTLKNVLTYYENNNDPINSVIVLNEIGLAYIVDNQPGKALIFFNSALAEYGKLVDSLGITKCRYYIGNSLYQQGSFEEAILEYNISLETALNNGYEEEAIKNYLGLSRSYMAVDSLEKTSYYLDNALQISKKLNNVEIEAELYLVTADYNISNGDNVAAEENMATYIQLQESIFIENNKDLTVFLEEISSYNKNDKGLNAFTIIFILILIILLGILIIVLIKLKKQNTTHKSSIEKCKLEIEAFSSNLVDFDKKVEEKSKERLDEIENEIKRNEVNQVALTNSQANLSQVNHFKDMFLSKISHEIRTPLSGILGFAEILETQLAIDEENDLFEYAKSITDSGMSLVTLLNNILDISRLNSNTIKLNIDSLNINELIQTVVDKHITEANLKGLKLIFESSTVTEIQTDNQLLSKVITLILNNSIKFTEKGFIKISKEIDESDKVISIIIKDTGIGIDKVYLDQVFEPYRQESLGYSTSYQGAGLGLPLAKKMTTKLGGTIILESDKGVGTSVILTFPISHIKAEKEEVITKPIEEKPVAKEVTKHKFPWETLSILVVEDDAMNQLLYRKMLKSAKNLEIAKDGKVALAMIEKHLDDNTYDLVLMDINLPSPWDGISLMKKIREEWSDYKNIPFIAQTAYAMSGNRESMLEEGFDEYLNKPIIKSVLSSTIEKVIDL